jgi:ATP-dependent exoDNAse (exonuclease V) alpha subunit
MAIFRLEAKIISREGRGRSVIAAAAYRAGTKLKDEARDKTFDYTRRGKSVIRSTILAPEGAPEWVFDSVKLWNTVEAGEKRVDAQLAREFVLALPRELSRDAQFELAKKWAQDELVAAGMVVELSHHSSRDGKNPHVHILCTLRKLDGDKFSAKKSREWNDKALLIGQRESWAAAANAALEAAGSDERIDHRSLADQGIDRIPEPKLGAKACALKRTGRLLDPERFQRWREVKMLNDLKPFIDSIRRFGEIRMHGMGETWWERSMHMVTKAKERTAEAVKASWQKLLDSPTGKEGKDGPDITR